MTSSTRFATAFFATVLASNFVGTAAATEEGVQYRATTEQGDISMGGDAAMTARLTEQLAREPSLKGATINVQITDGVVHLSGTAVTPEQVQTAVQFANTVQGAKSVTNDIQVK